MSEVETFAEDVSRLLAHHPELRWKFKVSGPCTLTVKLGKEFRRRPFIGDEELQIDFVWANAKGGLVYRFEQRDVVGDRTLIEMTEKEAMQNLDRFKEWTAALVIAMDDAELGKIRDDAKEKEDAAYNEAKLASSANPLFGSW